MSSYDPGHIQLTEEQLQCSTMISAPPLHIEIFNFHNQKHKDKITIKTPELDHDCILCLSYWILLFYCIYQSVSVISGQYAYSFTSFIDFDICEIINNVQMYGKYRYNFI